MMKKLMFAVVVMMFPFVSSNAQTEQVKSAVTAFIQASDANDAAKLSEILHPEYRVVMNQLFGSKDVACINKEVYVSKIKSKEWGGDDRTITFKKVTVVNKTAIVEVLLEGKKMTFESVLTLVKDHENKWLLMSDFPEIKS